MNKKAWAYWYLKLRRSREVPPGTLLHTNTITAANLQSIVAGHVGFAEPSYWTNPSNMTPKTTPIGGTIYMARLHTTTKNFSLSINGRVPNSGFTYITVNGVRLDRTNASYWDQTPGETGFLWNNTGISFAPGDTVILQWYE